MRPPQRSPLSLVLRTPTHLGSAPPVALFGRNLGLLGPWALVGEGGNRPGGADWHGDYSRGGRAPGWPMGCKREEELGVHGNARGDGDLGLRRNWGAEEMEASRVLGQKGDPGAGVHGQHSPDEGSRVVPGGLHWCGSSVPRPRLLNHCPVRPAPRRLDPNEPGPWRQAALLRAANSFGSHACVPGPRPFVCKRYRGPQNPRFGGVGGYCQVVFLFWGLG